jgi:feruloyl esterase
VNVLDWALRQPEKRTDWGWRAIHGSTDLAKKLTAGYYGKKVTYSYYSGCSTGGRQGLKEIQNYPESFDGALIGAPAWYTSHVNTWVTKVATYNLPVSDPKHIGPDSFLTWYADAVRNQCDPQDGVTDGIVSSPETCSFDYTKVRCGTAGVNASQCYTDAQINTTKNIYADYKDAKTGQFLYHGLSRGSETQWNILLGDSAPSPFGTGFERFFMYDDPFWSWEQYNDSVVYDAERLNPGMPTADNYDLSKFKARGGKMIMYHGTADGIVPTKGSNLYYDRVTAAMGGDPRDFFRLFLVPGMQHCWATEEDAPWAFGGAFQAGWLGHDQWSVPGYRDSRHDALMALMDWVEKGIVVEQIVATTWNLCDSTVCYYISGVLRQRPICPWPKKATLMGGNEKVATNWVCL